jgi:hypothetical protein
MMFLTFRVQKEPGFRLNLTDLLLLALLAILSFAIYSYTTDRYIYLLPLYVGFSFFLFCNVFRIGNRIEPIWYIPFTLTVIWGLNSLESFWAVVLLICEPLRWALILFRILKGPYRGAFHRQINARLAALASRK